MAGKTNIRDATRVLRKEALKEVRNAMRRFATKLRKRIRQNAKAVGLVKTGGMIKSWKTQTKKRGEGYYTRVYTTDVAATANEKGSTIRPRRRKYLTVPLSDEARELQAAANGKVRNIPGLKMHKAKNGNLYLVRPIEAVERAFKPLFALKKEVRLTPRPFIRPAFDATKAELEPEIKEGLIKAVQKTGATIGIQTR